MLDHIGTASWGTLVMLISLAASMAVKKKKNLESLIDSFTVYFTKPVQLGDTVEVIVKIAELGRNACSLDVAIMSDGSAVMRAMMSSSYIKK
jgi:predicted transcriptional regulator